MIKKEISNRIKNVNLILTFLIVLMHSNCFSYANSESIFYNKINIIENILSSLLDICVPTFFFISAYLFFRKINSKEEILSKIKKRIKTILIPYLFFSTFFLFYAIILSNFAHRLGMTGEIKTIEYNIISFIKYILLGTYGDGLWYLRDLFILFLLSIGIYYLIKYLKKGNILIILGLIILNIFINVQYNSVLNWLPFYYFGSYISYYYHKKIEEDSYNFLKYKKLIFIIYLALLGLYTIFYSNLGVEYLYRFFSPILILSICFKNKNLSKKSPRIASNSFIIYCTHAEVAVLIKRILLLFMGNNPIVLFLLKFIVCFLTIIIINYVILLIKTICPKLINIISGGRAM